MSDCTNLEMRDLLPELARGALTGPSLVAVEQHLASCASCRAELALVRNAQAVLSATPSIDASRIAAAVVRSSSIRRNATTTVAETRRRRAWSLWTPSRRVWLAAASIVAVAGATVLATNIAREPDLADLPPVVIHTEEPAAPAPIAPERTAPVRGVTLPPARDELVLGGGVSDLADADLESLLRALDGLDAQLDLEPAPLLPRLEGDA
jgi:anti-sigma factor RsiW